MKNLRDLPECSSVLAHPNPAGQREAPDLMRARGEQESRDTRHHPGRGTVSAVPRGRSGEGPDPLGVVGKMQPSEIHIPVPRTHDSVRFHSKGELWLLIS